jgi:hypothetical protein
MGSCYAVDAAATSVFPPAIALAPLCNAIGITGGAASSITSVAK